MPARTSAGKLEPEITSALVLGILVSVIQSPPRRCISGSSFGGAKLEQSRMGHSLLVFAVHQVYKSYPIPGQSAKHTLFQKKWSKSIPISDQNRSKTMPFGAAIPEHPAPTPPLPSPPRAAFSTIDNKGKP